ncbi:MAG: YjdF family protein [Oscillospiraceae bacterium]
MPKIEGTLTVFFEKPFWVGVYERREGGRLEVCKVTFGAEPKDYQVYALFLKNWDRLQFSQPVKADGHSAAAKNPKRMQREIKKQVEGTGVGTKAQQAIKLQQADGKEARTRRSRQEREQREERLFALRQEKKKQKHRGH